MTHDELVDSLMKGLELPSAAADDVVNQLIEAGVIVHASDGDEFSSALCCWEAHGWGDAALFHYSTFGQPFDPDTLADVNYEDYYRSILEDEATAGPQPPAAKPVPLPRSAFRPVGAFSAPILFADVPAQTAPINCF